MELVTLGLYLLNVLHSLSLGCDIYWPRSSSQLICCLVPCSIVRLSGSMLLLILESPSSQYQSPASFLLLRIQSRNLLPCLSFPNPPSMEKYMSFSLNLPECSQTFLLTSSPSYCCCIFYDLCHRFLLSP